jgi:hypothetical protein
MDKPTQIEFIPESDTARSLVTTIHARRTVKYYFVQESELNMISGFNNQIALFGSISFGLVTFVLGTCANYLIEQDIVDGKRDWSGLPMLGIVCGACLLLAFGSAIMAAHGWFSRGAAIKELKVGAE